MKLCQYTENRGKITFMYIQSLLSRYPALQPIQEQIEAAYDMLIECFSSGHAVYTCGNGGSSADCEHITGELMKPFRLARPLTAKEKSNFQIDGLEEDTINCLTNQLQKALPTFSLVSSSALNSAIANDMGSQYVFAQQIYGYGKTGDILLCISTSGNSENIVLAAIAAKAAGVRVLSLSGRDGGKLAELSDICIICPAQETEEIQEYHLPVYHTLCAMLENYFWGGNKT